MEIEYDEVKRQITLERRGLDFCDAELVFDTDYIEVVDDRGDYGETRYITYGWLRDRPVAIVWTPRGNARRIISMKHSHAKEIATIRRTLD